MNDHSTQKLATCCATVGLNHKALAILAHLLDHSGGCTYRKLMAAGQLSYNGAYCHLKRLERLGLVRHEHREYGSFVATCRFIPL